jgi:uncharacterized protein YoxC
MENWQLTVVILGSVAVGALIPLLIVLTTAIHRVGREIGEVGAQLRRTLTQVESIAQRVEVLSRGLEGGETKVAELLTSVGHLANGLEQNMEAVNVIAAVGASLGAGLAAFAKTSQRPSEPEEPTQKGV